MSNEQVQDRMNFDQCNTYATNVWQPKKMDNEKKTCKNDNESISDIGKHVVLERPIFLV